MKWNSELYDNKHEFVAEYGKGLFEFIPDNKEQAILDLGCGTGTLTDQLLKYGKTVVGVDSSQEMIERAKKQFDKVDFRVCDALNLPFAEEFNVVFSNAVFHWISDHDTLLKNINKTLKPGGMLVCEFGGVRNVDTIIKAFAKACSSIGYDVEERFNFPTPESFGMLLEKNGFEINRVYDYDRPTPLKDADRGLENWMRQFFAVDLARLSEEQQSMVIRQVEGTTKEKLWNGNEWVADYRRLRAIARKM